MQTEIFDKNGVEITVGAEYITHLDAREIYTVFWKGGAICGGKSFEDCEPLCWNSKDAVSLFYDPDLYWLELI